MGKEKRTENEYLVEGTSGSRLYLVAGWRQRQRQTDPSALLSARMSRGCSRVLRNCKLEVGHAYTSHARVTFLLVTRDTFISCEKVTYF